MKSLSIMMQSSEKKEVRFLIQTLRMDLENGRELSHCLRRHPEVFDSLSCQLIHIGEQTGNLDRSLKRITHYKEKNDLLRKQLKQALLYPLFITATTLLTTLFLLLFVVPQFAILFAHFPNQLPLLTRGFIQLSFYLRHSLKAFSLISVISLFLLFHFQGHTLLRNRTRELLLKLYPLRSFVLQITLSRFSRALALMLSAGLPLTEALLLAAELSPFDEFRKKVQNIHAGVQAGRPLSAYFNPPFFVSPLLLQLTRIGEESGTLDSMLEKFADFSESELDQKFTLLKRLLEPLIIAILGVLIACVVLAMYLPIFRLGTAIA